MHSVTTSVQEFDKYLTLKKCFNHFCSFVFNTVWYPLFKSVICVNIVNIACIFNVVVDHTFMCFICYNHQEFLYLLSMVALQCSYDRWKQTSSPHKAKKGAMTSKLSINRSSTWQTIFLYCCKCVGVNLGSQVGRSGNLIYLDPKYLPSDISKIMPHFITNVFSM